MVSLNICSIGKRDFLHPLSMARASSPIGHQLPRSSGLSMSPSRSSSARATTSGVFLFLTKCPKPKTHQNRTSAEASALQSTKALIVFFIRYEIGRDTSELQSQSNLVCRLLLEKKKPRTTD